MRHRFGEGHGQTFDDGVQRPQGCDLAARGIARQLRARQPRSPTASTAGASTSDSRRGPAPSASRRRASASPAVRGSLPSATASIRPSSSASAAPIWRPEVTRSIAASTPTSARQALRAACAGQQAQRHFRQAHARARQRHADMRAQRDLQPAAQHGAVQGSDDGLADASMAAITSGRIGGMRRLAEFGKSAPAMKVRPAQNSTATRAVGVGGQSRHRVGQPRRTAADRALTGGLSIWMNAMSPSRQIADERCVGHGQTSLRDRRQAPVRSAFQRTADRCDQRGTDLGLHAVVGRQLFGQRAAGKDHGLGQIAALRNGDRDGVVGRGAVRTAGRRRRSRGRPVRHGRGRSCRHVPRGVGVGRAILGQRSGRFRPASPRPRRRAPTKTPQRDALPDLEPDRGDAARPPGADQDQFRRRRAPPARPACRCPRPGAASGRAPDPERTATRRRHGPPPPASGRAGSGRRAATGSDSPASPASRSAATRSISADRCAARFRRCSARHRTRGRRAAPTSPRASVVAKRGSLSGTPIFAYMPFGMRVEIAGKGPGSPARQCRSAGIA